MVTGEQVPQSTARQCICGETIFKCKTCPSSNSPRDETRKYGAKFVPEVRTESLYGRLSDVPKDFVALNVKPVPKPIVADSVDEDIDFKVDISSDESENED